MLQSNRRGALVLYTILALVVLMLIFTSAVAPPLGVLLLSLYAALLLLTSRRWRLPRRQKKPRSRPLAVTKAARDALDRAPRGSSLLPEPYLLQDIGVIVDERRPDGIALRRARFLSLDDESLRPYVVMHFPTDQYPQQILVRFEITDTSGDKQYIYEMQHLLRPGENLILPNYRLPLKGNSRLSRSGMWDLTIIVDGKITAVHQFNLLPSMAERLRGVSVEGEVSSSTRLMIEEQSEYMPQSLEDLLRGRSRS